MQLKYKISISMTVVSLVVLLLVSFIYSQMSYKRVIKHETKVLLENAVEASEEIKSELLSRLDNVQTLATVPIVLESLKQSNLECVKEDDETYNEHIRVLNEKWMKAYDEENEFVKPYMNNPLALFLKKQQSTFEGVYGEIFITNTHGVIIATTGKLTTLAHSYKYWFKEAYAEGEGKIFFDDRGFDASVKGYVIGIVVPVKENGKVIGILKANVNITSAMSKVVNNYKNIHKSSLEIVRTKGDIVYEDALPPLSTSANPQILNNLKNMEIGSRLIKDYNKNILIAYAPVNLNEENENIIFGGRVKSTDSIKGNDREIWHTVVIYDKELALQESMKTNMIIVYIGLLFSVLTWVVAFYVGRWISKPIEELQRTQVKLKKQEDIMVAQSRHAAMGEMISIIAHQWRQPISVIAMGANNIMADVELERVEENKLKKYSNDIINKTQELSKTIDDFKNFFRPDKEFSDVLMRDVFDDVFGVIGESLKNAGIEVRTEYHNEKTITTYSRELMQVLINMVKNAQEAIVDSDNVEKKISILVNETQSEIMIKICDSGGGIKKEIIGKIFDPYFSTKNQNVGTGLGLYMSKTIIEKHLNGIIEVYNLNNGVCFEIKLPFKLEKSEE